VEKSKSSNQKPSFRFLSLGLLVVPFLVGFDYPDSTGTYAKLSGGGGRYRFTPSCSHYNYGSDFQEGEFAMEHRMATKPVDANASRWEKIKPGHITYGFNADLIKKDITVLSYNPSGSNTDGEAWSPGFGDPKIGDHSSTYNFALGTKFGFDWKWMGAEMGGSVLSYGDNNLREGNNGDALPFPIMPILGLRLGDADLIYGSYEILGSSPIYSGGGLATIGIGGKVWSTRLWIGVGELPFRDAVAVVKVTHPFGPLAVSLSAEAGPKNLSSTGDYGMSVGFQYRLFP